MVLVALVILLPVILSAVGYKWLRPDWEEEVQWGRAMILGGAAGVAAAGIALWLADWVAAPSVFATAILSWLTPVVCVTDYSVYKIPRGVSRLARYVALIPLVWAAFVAPSWVAVLGVTVAMLFIPFVMMWSGGIGFGDIRLLIVAAVALPWWTTMYTFMLGFLLAAALQIITFVVAGILKRGQEVDYTKGKILRPLGKLVGKDIPVRSVKKRATPFGPALMFAFVITAFYTLAVHGAGFPDSVIATF